MGNTVHGLGLGKTDEWVTPPRVFEALGDPEFDLDVACPVLKPPHIRAREWYSQGALEREWRGFVWMNPPFGGRGALRPWLEKFIAHGNGLALTPDRVSAPWFQDLWPYATAVLFTPKTSFLLPDGSKSGNPAFGNAIWACGPRAMQCVNHAADSGFGRLTRVIG